MASLTLHALPGGEDTAGSLRGHRSLCAPWLSLGVQQYARWPARSACGWEPAQSGIPAPHHGRGALGCPWRCRSPHARTARTPGVADRSAQAVGEGRTSYHPSSLGSRGSDPFADPPPKCLKTSASLRGKPRCPPRPPAWSCPGCGAPAGQRRRWACGAGPSLGSPFASPVGGGRRTFGQLLGLPCAVRPRQEGVGRREPRTRAPRGTPWTPAPRHLDAQRGPV